MSFIARCSLPAWLGKSSHSVWQGNSAKAGVIIAGHVTVLTIVIIGLLALSAVVEAGARGKPVRSKRRLAGTKK